MRAPPPFRPLNPLVAEVADAYERLGARGVGVLLAVSGGADSVALLIASTQIAPQLSLRLEVACLDHGLRKESAAEVEQVRALATAHQLPFHTRALTLAAGPGLEARARQARYQALEALRLERSLTFVATAHTATDQAETLLMRLARGASLRGARGVHPARGSVVRPLLRVVRSQVREFVAAAGAAYSEDPMNADPAFLRSRVRHSVLPALRTAAGPHADRALAGFAQRCAEDEELLGRWADQAFSRLLVQDGVLDALGVLALERPLQRRVLVRLIEAGAGEVDAGALARAQKALETGGSTALAGGWGLSARGGLLRCVPPHGADPRQPPAPAPLLLDGPWVQDAPSGMWLRLCRASPGGAGLTLAVPERPLPFVVRHRAVGDRVQAAGRHRKLQDVLVDRKVRRELRDALPIVCDGAGEILWVVGVWPVRSPYKSRAVWHLVASTEAPSARAPGPL